MINEKLLFHNYRPSDVQISVVNQTADESFITDETFKQVTNLMEMVRTSARRSSEAAALYMDETSNIIQHDTLDTRVEVMMMCVNVMNK